MAANIDLITANKVNVGTLTQIQLTLVAAAAITAGAPVLINGDGKWINSDADDTGVAVGCYGVATRTVAAGEALTAIRRGLMDGWDLTALDYGQGVFVSDDVGRLYDVAGSTSLAVGFVVPVPGTTLGTVPDKALFVDCTASPLVA